MAKKKAKIPNNVYTALIGFSFLALTATTVFLYIKTEEVGLWIQFFKVAGAGQ